jgi:nicotinate-nucleotide adenylyltransferase
MLPNIQPPISKFQLPTSRIGVLGGTFDPPHNGHIAIAEQALTQLQLSQVLFAPARLPPHKNAIGITPIDHRLEMVRLAIADHPRFAFSRIDIDRARPTYTADTMSLLREQLGADIEFYFIMGTDSLANILTWYAPEKLIHVCRLAVFYRPGFDADLDALEKQLPGLRARVVLLSSPALDIAASDLQRRIHAGELITQLVPPRVEAYIAQHKLYR